jgi:hypothetical protein
MRADDRKLIRRVRMSLKQNLAVKIVAGYVAFGFVLMEILYLGVWCRPFSEYWAVPTDNSEWLRQVNRDRLETPGKSPHADCTPQFNAQQPQTI